MSAHDDLDDDELVQQVLSGDARAVRRFVLNWRSRLGAMIRKIAEELRRDGLPDT